MGLECTFGDIISNPLIPCFSTLLLLLPLGHNTMKAIPPHQTKLTLCMNGPTLARILGSLFIVQCSGAFFALLRSTMVAFYSPLKNLDFPQEGIPPGWETLPSYVLG